MGLSDRRADRVIVQCEGCGRSYLGRHDGEDPTLLVGDRCPRCNGVEFAVVGEP